MPCNLYGPKDNYHPENSHVIPGLIRRFHSAGERPVKCWGDGSPMREFLYVDDFADACLFAISHYEEADLINVGSGEDIPIKELAKIIAEITSYKGEILWDLSKPNATPKRSLAYSKSSSLGWKPKYKLKKG